MLSAHPGPPAPTAAPPALTPLLAMTDSAGPCDVEYVIGGQHLAGADRELAAWLPADDAMRIRCGQSPALGLRADAAKRLVGQPTHRCEHVVSDRIPWSGRYVYDPNNTRTWAPWAGARPAGETRMSNASALTLARCPTRPRGS
jgi:hypothetical protein